MISGSFTINRRFENAITAYRLEKAKELVSISGSSLSKLRYKFYGNNKAAFDCLDSEVMLAGPADTGKTITMLSKLHWYAANYENASIVIARKQLTDTYSTVLQTYLNKILLPDDPVVPYGGNKPQWFDYPNGSRIWVAGLDKPGKVLSAEHDIAYVNQAEELDLIDWETLTTRTSGRAGNMPFSQCIGDCNPAHPTHWILARANAGHLTKLDSVHRDNPDLYNQETGELTEEGEKRIGVLRKLTGTRLFRLYHGLWAAPEGAIYSVFEEEKHKVKSFSPHRLWPRIVAIDPYGAVVAAVWFAFDVESGILNAYREYRGEFGISTADHARNILDICKQNSETIFAFVGGGPSENQARLDFTSAGIPLLEPPNIGVESGIDRVIRLLNEFSLVIHDNCIGVLSDIGGYRRKLRDGTPTDVIENKDTFHFADCIRYGVSWLVGDVRETEEIVYNRIRI